MDAPDILARLAAAGIQVTPLPDGRLWAEPSALLTDDLRELISKHRAELLAALPADGEAQPDPETAPAAPSQDPAAEARRRKVLAMLDVYPAARYALTADTETDPDAVIVALAIRGVATVEFRIAPEKFDPFALLSLLEMHGGTLQ